MPYLKNGVGYQNTDTSENAAKTVNALPIRNQILKLMRYLPYAKFSTTNIATILMKPYCSVQPRLSELRNNGDIVDSGLRAETKYGKPEIVWELKP